MPTYNTDFYDSYRIASHRSATLYLKNLIELIKPKSILDVGCGVGTWLRAANELGVEQIQGVDGDYVKSEQLEIDPARFRAHDLTKPLNLGEKFDLAISMEVGEHLPTERSKELVDTLVRHADIVLLSAAIPHQGGTDHINEQWPDFWAAKFAERGYVLVDWLRPQLWNENEIDYYYIQNGFLYIKADILKDYPELESKQLPADHWSLRTVHPTKWMEANNPRRATFRFASAAFFHSFPAAFKRRIMRLFDRGF
jgi:SAM-dependent methyltransferase